MRRHWIVAYAVLGAGVLKGREAIGAWYRNIWADMKETITPLARPASA